MSLRQVIEQSGKQLSVEPSSICMEAISEAGIDTNVKSCVQFINEANDPARQEHACKVLGEIIYNAVAEYVKDFDPDLFEVDEMQEYLKEQMEEVA